MKIATMQEVDAALATYYAVTHETLGREITIERTERLMAHLGNPEKRLRIVHIAGTSGKTSTTYYTAALLRAAGKKVGHTVSPHVDSLTERIQINGQPLSEEVFCEYLGEFLGLIATAPEKPTWFEVLIGFVFWVFAVKEKVDYAVLETGLGGLQDSTNVAARTDKLCVITDIGFDHMHVLGNRLGSIAHQKAGIIHDGNIALMYEQDPEVMQVVRYWASQQEDAEVYAFQQFKLEEAYKGDFVEGLPEYQQRNWLLAWAAYRFLARRDSLKLPTEDQVEATQRIVVPGRMEVREVASKTIVLDGAHNQQKMQAFVSSFQAKYPGKKPVVLMALKQGKEIAEIAPILVKLTDNIIVTTFQKSQDLPFTSIEPSEIVSVLVANGAKNCVAEPDTHKAFERFMAETTDIGVITGSFFLLSQIREREGLR